MTRPTERLPVVWGRRAGKLEGSTPLPLPNPGPGKDEQRRAKGRQRAPDWGAVGFPERHSWPRKYPWNASPSSGSRELGNCACSLPGQQLPCASGYRTPSGWKESRLVPLKGLVFPLWNLYLAPATVLDSRITKMGGGGGEAKHNLGKNQQPRYP